MDAGHFDTKTAYAAANTLRLDDMNPHFWRTHDGGKTWTEIDNGIAGGAVANSIREDPRKKGLLYAATDTQVWVSFDDGDNWHSLRLDMPAISVRDIEVKDDASCMCSDLVAGTHGRGFWILDDVTPLRQAAEAAAAIERVSVQAGHRHPHSLRHQRSHAVAAGIAGRRKSAARRAHRLLPARGRRGEVKLEFLNAQGKVIRTYSQHRPGAQPRSGHRSGGLQQDLPADPHRARLRPPALLAGAAAGAENHRRHAPLQLGYALRSHPGGGGGGRGGGGGGGAVPHRTYPGVNSPWVAPGAYTVRLTANGKSMTQPITVKMDPRVKITPEVQQIFTLTTQMEDNARDAAAAYKEARALADKIKARPQSAANDALLKQVEEIAPVVDAAPAGGGRRWRAAVAVAAAASAAPRRNPPRSAEPEQHRRRRWWPRCRACRVRRCRPRRRNSRPAASSKPRTAP